MAGQAPIQNSYPISPGAAWNGQDLQQPYYGQVPKRRGPKPDSKPAQTRRQELNRQAQRTHRERKEQYIKALEMELDRFKEVYVNDLNQANHVRRENMLLREILASRGINADQELAGRGAPVGLDTSSGMQIKDSNSISPPQMQPTRALSANLPYLSHTPSTTGYSPMGDHVFPSGSGNASVATHSPGISMQSYGTHQSSPSGPDIQELVIKQEGDGVPAMPGIFEHNPQLAVDFILQLEQTCRDHGEYLVRRSVASPDSAEDAQISGHALMASVTPVRHVREVRPEQGGLIPTRPHQMADTETLQLLQNLLRTSSEAKQAMNLLGGQVTPVMAMQSLRSHRYYHSLTEEDVRRMIEAIKGHVRCYGFGAVMEDFELRDALDVVFATKPEAYDSIGGHYPAEVDDMYSGIVALMAHNPAGNEVESSDDRDQDEDETNIELLREEAADIANRLKTNIIRQIANVVADLGETRFRAIGGFVIDSPAGPTIKAAKVFIMAGFHSPEYYNIGPYADSKEYILACDDREIAYYTHVSETDIIEEAFENTSVADFVDILKRERLALLNEASLFQDIDAEPRVLDFHTGNMLVRDGHLVAILDWEFSSVYPLSELLGAASIIQGSSPGRDEQTMSKMEWEELYHRERME
ncbi:hypothetical protein DV735_g957, partial [Chaetothyriales sp. CBS 134920]